MNQRVKDVVKELKKQRKIHSQADFAQEVGIGAVQLSEIVSGKRKISEYYVNKILTRFPEINKDWLVSGDGGGLLHWLGQRRRNRAEEPLSQGPAKADMK